MRKIKITTLSCSLVLLLFVFLLSACGQTAKSYPANPAPVATGLVPATESAIPVTGGSGPGVIVSDQTFDGTNVVVAKVVSQGPGWMTIHNQQNGDLGPVIGYTHINDGENDNVIVKVDPKQTSPVMYGMLHVDSGTVGTYEFPGPDLPFMLNGQMIAPAFKATVGQASSTLPTITIRDQNVSGGKVIIDQVVSNSPGWIAIHIQNKDGTAGQEIGYSAVKKGTTTNVAVTIDASKATPVLHAMLHIDVGEIGTYEYPGPDIPVMANGQMVAPTFSASPAVAANTTPTAQATSSMDMGATPTGVAAPAYATTAPAAATGATPTAVSADMGMVMATPAAGVIPDVTVSDQTIQNGLVRVDQVVSNGPGWITIYTVANDQPDQPLGHAPVQNGDNKNVMVQIDSTKATATLYALLQVDAGKVGVFEFPGPDGAVMLGVKMIARPFKNLTAGAAVVPPTRAVPVPSITVQDQPIHNGTIVISQVVSIGDAWLVIHPRNPDGTTGDYIGYAQVKNGINSNVLVKIDVRRATQTLFAMLHVNASKAASPQFPGADEPVMVGGQMLLPPFRVIGALTGDVPLGVAKNSSGTPYLVDGVGMSLYIFLNDTPGKSNCTGDCLNEFRPLKATGKLVPGNGVLVGKLGVIVLPDGTRQVIYSGSPLYYYIDDTKPGDTLAQGDGGIWFLVTP